MNTEKVSKLWRIGNSSITGRGNLLDYRIAPVAKRTDFADWSLTLSPSVSRSFPET
jgi:hypothetical protein